MFLTSFALATTLAQSSLAPANQPKLLADVGSWAGTVSQVADYYWLKSNTVLFWRQVWAESPILFTLKLSTTQVQESKLAKVINDSSGSVESISVSPNGEKVLWESYKDKQSSWSIANIDGSEYKQFPRRKTSMIVSNHGPDDETIAFWSTDSKSVFESIIDFGDGAFTRLWSRPIDSINKERSYPLAKGYVDWQPVMIGKNLAFAKSGLANGGPRSSVGFITWNIENPKLTRKAWTVNVPKGRTIVNFSHSPSGTEILWDLSVKASKEPQSWDSKGEEFWVSDVRGKSWKQVYRIDFDPKNAGADASALGGVMWRPDGRAFSYIYKKKLYLVER
ncbi:MAG: hypothetical protein WCI55_00310 [Armatimonadota bacterium]